MRLREWWGRIVVFAVSLYVLLVVSRRVSREIGPGLYPRLSPYKGAVFLFGVCALAYLYFLLRGAI